VARFEVRHAQDQAQRLGTSVEKLVDKLLSNEYPLRHLRRVQGILRLAKCHPITAEALDHACQKTLCFNKSRVNYIKDCALYFVAHGQRPTLSVPQRKADTVHLYQLAAQAEIIEEELL
jgi:hypothetical protein